MFPSSINLSPRTGLRFPKRSSLLPETLAYKALLEAASAELLAPNAVNTYFAGLKAEGIWDKIKASALFAGVSFPGCFVPLRSDMPTPTNLNFDDTRHDAVTGLQGDGSTMFIDLDESPNGLGFGSGASYDAHTTAFVTTAPTLPSAFLGAGSVSARWVALIRAPGGFGFRAGGNPILFEYPPDPVTGFYGFTKTGDAQSNLYAGVATTDQSYASNANNSDLHVFRRSDTTLVSYSDVRLLTFTAGNALGATGLAKLRDLQIALRDNIAAELA